MQPSGVPSPGLCKSEQDGGENRDNSDDDEQFNERKTRRVWHYDVTFQTPFRYT